MFGVFYTEGGQAQLETYYDQGRGARDRDTRRNHDPIVGYYGGADAGALDSVTLKEPVVSAGRSPVLGVTDPNLETSELETITLVTIEKTAPEGEAADPEKQLKLMLRKEHGVVSVRVIADGNVVLPIDDSFVKLSGDLGKETTYSIDLAQLKANKETGPHLADIADGDEYRVTARVTTSKALCRPAYGYGSGVWPSASDEVVFTSNIIADYENEADLYVYRDEANMQGGNVPFNLENWYNDLTAANEDLYYRIEANAGIYCSVTREGVEVPLKGDYYAYPYVEGDKTPHRVALKIADISSVPEGTVMDVRVNVYRENERFDVPGDPSKTLTIHVHVMNQRPFDYHVEDHGSYAEVVVTAGTEATGSVVIVDNTAVAVSDQSSTAYANRAYDGTFVELNSIPAGGSTSIKFFKTNTGVTLDESSFIVYGPGQ